jgi:hypothetical protein
MDTCRCRWELGDVARSERVADGVVVDFGAGV